MGVRGCVCVGGGGGGGGGGPSEQHRDSELLKSFRSNIKDGPYGCHLENLQTMSSPEE